MRTTSLSRPLPAGLLLTALLTLLWSGAARAQLSFTLDSASLSGAPGAVLPFSGTLTNTGTSEVFLNTDGFTLAGSGLSLSDDPFFDTMPTSLLPGDSASGELFDVILDASAQNANYPGTFTIRGGATLDSDDTLATQQFRVTVVPEPDSYALLGLGLPGLLLLARRRRSRTES